MTHLVHCININVHPGQQRLDHHCVALQSCSHQGGVAILHEGV